MPVKIGRHAQDPHTLSGGSFMKTDDLIHRSIFIITEYYKNNLTPFFESISDDILWLGPAERQQIQGRENLIRTWAAEEHALTFTMGSITALCVSPHAHVKEILLHYNIYTHYPDSSTDLHDQRLHYTWREKRTKTAAGWEARSEIVMLHISNLWKYDSRDIIYPVHRGVMAAAEPERFVTVKASDLSVHRIEADRILYIETVKCSAKLLMHMTNGTLTVNATLSELEKNCPELFLRVHAGYLLNPAHVREIRRFSVTLSDGTQLPVPEKKYTLIKGKILQARERM